MSASRDSSVEASTWIHGELTPHRGALSLLFLSDRATERVGLPAEGAATVGRSEEADITFNERGISRQHFRVHMGAELMIEDLGSSNGTRLRGDLVAPHTPVPLAVGEAFQIGEVTCVIQEDHLQQLAHEEPHREGRLDLEALLPRVARGRINVLLLGETGVGKEVTARRIHELSPRAEKPFIAVNCGALSETLVESEFFGHEQGAFTGAVQAKMGLIEASSGGTLFLDEIGDMPPSIQIKLLRVLDLRQVVRVGSHTPRQVDLRVVAATHRDLQDEIAQGRFREDLYFRVCGVPVVIPPLRERREEIPRLLELFLAETARANDVEPVTLSREAQAWLMNYDYPGNIRELRNIIQRGVLMATDGCIDLSTLRYSPSYGVRDSRGRPSVTPAKKVDMSDPDAAERARIVDALAECGGNQTRAAKLLGISRRTLTNRLNRLKIKRPQKRV